MVTRISAMLCSCLLELRNQSRDHMSLEESKSGLTEQQDLYDMDQNHRQVAMLLTEVLPHMQSRYQLKWVL